MRMEQSVEAVAIQWFGVEMTALIASVCFVRTATVVGTKRPTARCSAHTRAVASARAGKGR
jgi:hypothetical protein